MKVFVSSLIAGMEAERAAVKRAIVALGHEPTMAESFGAKATSPQIACLQGVRQADVVVSVFGERYGTVQPSGFSATHEEFLEAQNRKPTLVFVQNGVHPEDRQQAFIREVGTWDGGLLRSEYKTPQELGDAVTRALHTWELAHAAAPLDIDELAQRAVGLLPKLANPSSVSGVFLSVGIAAGPLQSVLRPAELEQASLSEALQQEGLFGASRVFEQAQGTTSTIRQGALVVRQEGRRGDRAAVVLSENGDILLQLPAEPPMERAGFLAVIEEDVATRLRAAVGYGNWLLDRIDPTHKLTHVGIAARLVGSAWSWRTRAEQTASPQSGSANWFGDEAARFEPVMLTPPHRSRAALKMDAARIVEDLVVLLRRRWKGRA